MNIGTISPPLLTGGNVAGVGAVFNLSPVNDFTVSSSPATSPATFLSAFPILPPVGIMVGGYGGGAPVSPEETTALLITSGVISALGIIGIAMATNKVATVLGGLGTFLLGPLLPMVNEFSGVAMPAETRVMPKTGLQEQVGYNPGRVGLSIFEFNNRMPFRAVKNMKAGLKHLEQGRLLRATGGEDAWEESSKEYSSA